MPACDLLLWNQVIQTDQFLFFALGALTLWVLAAHVFLVLKSTHVALMLSVFMPNLGGPGRTKNPGWVSCWAAGACAA